MFGNKLFSRDRKSGRNPEEEPTVPPSASGELTTINDQAIHIQAAFTLVDGFLKLSYDRDDDVLVDMLKNASNAANRYKLTADNFIESMRHICDNDPNDKGAWRFTGSRLYGQVIERTDEYLADYHDDAKKIHYGLIGSVFPDNATEVVVPDWCSQTIPTLKSWQRKKHLRGDERAESDYRELLSQASSTARKRFDGVTLSNNDSLTRPLLDSKGEELVLTSQLTKLDNLYQKNLGLYERALQLVQASLCEDLNLGSYLEDFCDYVQSEAPVIKKLQAEVRSWFNRSDDEIVDDLASRLSDYLWHEKLKDQVDGLLTMEVEQAISEAIDWLSDELNRYTPSTAKPNISADTTVSTPDTSEISTVVPYETSNCNIKDYEQSSNIDKLKISTDIVPWLEPDDIADKHVTLEVVSDVNIPEVVVIDCRTAKLTDIEHKMTGYESKESRESISKAIIKQLRYYAEVSKSKGGLSGLSRLQIDKNKSPYAHTILYNKMVGNNAMRVYVAYLKVDNIGDDKLQEYLQLHNIQHLILFIGACDKKHQIEALQIITGYQRNIVSARGAGSV